jgi:hypothetical protein
MSDLCQERLDRLPGAVSGAAFSGMTSTRIRPAAETTEETAEETAAETAEETAAGTAADSAPDSGAESEAGTGGRAARERIADLVERYFLSLDDPDEELDDAWAAGLFTGDALVAFPMSRHEGIAGLPAYHRAALSAFAATQHAGSRAVVVLDGERATLRANLISTHVHHARNARPQGDLPPLLATGTFVDGEARRTPRGWRLSRLSFRLLWADGSPPPTAPPGGQEPVRGCGFRG